MKKIVLTLALIVGAVSAHAAAPTKPYYVSAPGSTLVRAGATTLSKIVVGSVAGGDATLNVYDSATVAGISASNLKFAIGVSASVTQSAQQRVMSLDAYFANGVVFSTASQAVTMTTTGLLTPSN